MKLSLDSITKDAAAWTAKGVALPQFDISAMRAQTKETPEWVHFGAGNIFRGFIGSLSQRLLNAGLAKTGIIACDTFDYEVIDKIYTAYDSLTLNVLLNPDGTTTREVLAGVAEGLKVDFGSPASAERLRSIFRAPSLKMLSFTITEKGYALRRPDGSLMPVVETDMANGPAAPRHVMAIVAALLYERYMAGALPMAVVSMDNCSHNGEKLMKSVVEVAEAWKDRGFVDDGFIAYLNDESKVAFPWSMIDKITLRPHPRVQESLEADGFEGMAPVVTDKKTFIAAFVNAEKPQYLVVEDKFPNGRPPLEKAGVYFCDRETVNMTERMKVTTCLNPL
ncbi:MAG: mannitol dehydrogenase family protein, partial [Kiritimatiellae bacterium]|nr:mannitol dehydrogenase family protein [Kiritimatiellia bacterium]